LKKYLLLIALLVAAQFAQSQNIDSLYFNLYTDSLKKGTHNYINVDAKYNNGRYLPLTAKDLIFTSDYGSFEGNSLVLPPNPTQEKVTITISLKSNKSITKSITLYIKKKEDNEPLKTNEQILNDLKNKNKKSKKKEKR
jgi:hypothetical protein